MLLQAETPLGVKSKLATTASPSGAMTQVTRQTASCSQAAAREQVTLGSKRHVMPCSGHTPPSPLADASQGASTQPVQPLFPTQSGCARSMGPEGGLDRGVRPGSGSGSRWLGVRYCLSSSEPAVGAGIWEEQTTRHADFTAWPASHIHCICTLCWEVHTSEKQDRTDLMQHKTTCCQDTQSKVALGSIQGLRSSIPCMQSVNIHHDGCLYDVKTTDLTPNSLGQFCFYHVY